MNKKGGHVDWVISMGIFIVYIFALFILLRPGIKPVYRPVTLLDNLEKNFEENVTWTVKMIPLFVRICRAGVTEITTIDVDDEYNKWGVNRAMKGKKEVSFPLRCVEGEEYSNSVIDLYLSQDLEVYNPKLFPGLVKICTPDDESYCSVELGVIEDIKGIRQNSLTKIGNRDYNELKESWGIPEDKDFAVYVDDELDGNLEGDEIIGAEPYEQASVFVRRIESQIVDKDGEVEGVAVYLQIW